MADVILKLPFAIEGHRFDKGLQNVPDRFLDRLPSSAEVVDAKKAAAIRKAKAEAQEKLKDPKTLKQARSGRGEARPLGKEQKPAENLPADGNKVADAGSDDLGALRREYKAKNPEGKDASPKWDANTLKEKIAAFDAG